MRKHREVFDLDCNNCGALLEVSPQARSFICTFCDAHLEVKQDGAAVWTEARDEIRAEVQELRSHAEVENLDREWRATREEFLVHGRHGRATLPSRAFAILPLAVGIPFAAMGVAAVSGGVGGAFGLICLVPLVVALFSSMLGFSNLKRFEKARSLYHRRRTALFTDLKAH